MSAEKRHELDEVFNPKSIAVVGATPDHRRPGYNFLKGLVDLKFDGQLFPINLEANEVLGLRGYKSIRDILDDVDFVIVTVPASKVPRIIRDCMAKGVKAVHIFSAGFKETGREEGRKLEKKIAEIAQKGNVRIIGPNCMGIYHPSIGISYHGYFTSRESGTVAFISQSGNNLGDMARMGHVRGVRFSKLVSYGNACDLDSTDFMEYFITDPKTQIISTYIEGVKDGRRFFKAVKEAAKVKPVIIMKGGETMAGKRAVHSHTGAISGSEAIWEAVFHQTGAIRVDTLEEIIDLCLAFLHMPHPKGRGVGIVGFGGGVSVAAADACTKADLSVPSLTPDTITQLEEITPPAGTSVKNPVDTPVGVYIMPQVYEKTLRLVASDPQIDFLIAHLSLDWYMTEQGERKRLQTLVDTIINTSRELEKPVVVVLRSSRSLLSWQTFLKKQEMFLKAGLPVYSTIKQAAKATGKLIQYYEFRKMRVHTKSVSSENA